jgi:PHD/YefM family antitoxin component YafN of YafNO toxin-antitoxin module
MDAILINAVAFPADGMWIAQCLEFNFVSCAATRDELPGALLRQVLGQIEVDVEDGREPFFEFQPAPAKYWQLFEEAKLQREETRLFPFVVIITRDDQTRVVTLSLDDYNSLEETAYLLRSPKNAKRLIEAIADLEQDRGTERELTE